MRLWAVMASAARVDGFFWGEDDECAHAVYSGKYAYRKVVPMKKALEGGLTGRLSRLW